MAWQKQIVEHEDLLLGVGRVLDIQSQDFVTGAVVIDFNRMFYKYSDIYLPTRELQVLLSILAVRNQDDGVREMLVICCDSTKARDGSDAIPKNIFTNALFEFENFINELGMDVPFGGFYSGMRSGRNGSDTSRSGCILYSLLCHDLDISPRKVVFVSTGLVRLADGFQTICERDMISTRYLLLYDWVVEVEGKDVADDFANEFRGKVSSGERIIADWLTAHGFDFEREVTFESCCDKKALPFDFLVYGIQDVLIEFDGQQHFKAVNYFGGEQQLDYIMKHDEIKTKWAERHGVRLLRIRWDEDIDSVLSAEFLSDDVQF